MRFYKMIFSAVLTLLYCTDAISEELNANLNTQIELLSSCRVNDRQYEGSAQGLNLGELNFGKLASSFKGTVDASLTNEMNGVIKIQCNSILDSINISFGAGQNDSRVPDEAKTTYFRALSNGTSYIAYNLIYGSNRQILKPLDTLSFPNNDAVLNIDLYGQAILSEQAVLSGIYSDVIPVAIVF